MNLFKNDDIIPNRSFRILRLSKFISTLSTDQNIFKHEATYFCKHREW